MEQEQASLPGGGPLAADPSPSWPGPCGEGGGEEEEEREEGEEGKEGAKRGFGIKVRHWINLSYATDFWSLPKLLTEICPF